MPRRPRNRYPCARNARGNPLGLCLPLVLLFKPHPLLSGSTPAGSGNGKHWLTPALATSNCPPPRRSQDEPMPKRPEPSIKTMKNKPRTIQLHLEKWESAQWEIPIQSKPIVSTGRIRFIQSARFFQEPRATHPAQPRGPRTPPISRRPSVRRLISKTRVSQAILAGERP